MDIFPKGISRSFQTKTSKFCPQAFSFLFGLHILSGLVAEIPFFPAASAISIMGHVLPERDSYSRGQTLESFVLLKLIKVIHGVGKLFEGKKVAENLVFFFLPLSKLFLEYCSHEIVISAHLWQIVKMAKYDMINDRVISVSVCWILFCIIIYSQGFHYMSIFSLILANDLLVFKGEFGNFSWQKPQYFKLSEQLNHPTL